MGITKFTCSVYGFRANLYNAGDPITGKFSATNLIGAFCYGSLVKGDDKIADTFHSEIPLAKCRDKFLNGLYQKFSVTSESKVTVGMVIPNNLTNLDYYYYYSLFSSAGSPRKELLELEVVMDDSGRTETVSMILLDLDIEQYVAPTYYLINTHKIREGTTGITLTTDNLQVRHGYIYRKILSVLGHTSSYDQTKPLPKNYEVLGLATPFYIATIMERIEKAALHLAVLGADSKYFSESKTSLSLSIMALYKIPRIKKDVLDSYLGQIPFIDVCNYIAPHLK